MEKMPKAIVTVIRPELTDEEREKRMERIREALRDFAVAMMKKEGEKE